MTALNKQALRELIREAGNRKIIVHAKTVSELLDELETKEEQRANWFQMAQKLGEDLDVAEKRIEEGICRANREHHRGFMMACNHLKEHANIHYADAAEMEIAALRQRINELEARTVVVKQFDDFQIVHYGGSEDYAKGYIDCQNNYNKAITAAGIGVKGE